MKILEIKNLSKIYGSGNKEVKALDNISFSVEKGEFVAIVGASGSGKSTLLHMIGGVDNPTSGKVFINNTDIYSMNNNDLTVFRRRNIGLIYQFYNLLPILNVTENILLPLELDNKKIDNRKFEDIVETLKLSNRKTHLPNQLSGGQQQRVAIARALITEPSILLADEATGNLDSKTANEILELMRETNKKFNQTIILITHDMNIALNADRIITISDGKIVSDEVRS